MLQDPSRLLVVDDEPAVRLFLAEQLREADYQVSTAASGEEALAFLEQHTVDLVLLDLRMPGMDGVQTMAEIRRRRLPPEVIMLTGHATLDVAVAAMRHGGVDFLVKPCGTADLLTGVQRGLLRRQEALQRDAMTRLIAHTARRLTGCTDTATSDQASFPLARDRYLHERDLMLDRHARTVQRAGQRLALTATEFDVLAVFMGRPNQLWSYRGLALEIMGQEMSPKEARSALGTHLWRLRKKLGGDAGGQPYIINLRGRGYKFVG